VLYERGVLCAALRLGVGRFTFLSLLLEITLLLFLIVVAVTSVLHSYESLLSLSLILVLQRIDVVSASLSLG
jgi:hypothetical protein